MWTKYSVRRKLCMPTSIAELLSFMSALFILCMSVSICCNNNEVEVSVFSIKQTTFVAIFICHY